MIPPTVARPIAPQITRSWWLTLACGTLTESLGGSCLGVTFGPAGAFFAGTNFCTGFGSALLVSCGLGTTACQLMSWLMPNCIVCLAIVKTLL